jgi:hypothetical protein
MRLRELFQRTPREPKISEETRRCMNQLYDLWQKDLERIRENPSRADSLGEYGRMARETKLYDSGAMSVPVAVRSAYFAEYLFHRTREMVLRNEASAPTDAEIELTHGLGNVLEESIIIHQAVKRRGHINEGLRDEEPYSAPIVLAAMGERFLPNIGKKDTQLIAQVLKRMS